MISKEDVTFVKSELNKYRVNELLGLTGKYYDAFIDVFCWSYRETDAEVWVNSKYQRINNFFVKTCVVFGGALVSSIKSYFKYHNYIIHALNNRVIAMPFCGSHVRYKYIHDLVDENLTVQYPPLFHYQYLKAHISSFEERGNKISIGRFELIDIIITSWQFLKRFRSLKICHQEIDKYFSRNYGYFVSTIITSMLYKTYIDRLISIIPEDDFPRKWLFDYDFDYKYIVFNNEIKKHRRDDATFHLQHGAFFGYVEAYCNPVSDISLCCSQREKDIIETYNQYQSKIYALGSSLQSIDLNRYKKVPMSNDVLVLLTDTVLAETTEFQKKILLDLSHSGLTVLVRYRPQSADIDKKVLSEYTQGMIVSSGTTLKNDILSSKMVVCFSEDAVFECFRNNKRVVYIVSDTSFYNFTNAESSYMHIFSPETFDSSVFNIDLMKDEIDYSTDEFVRYNFGDFEFDKIRDNLNNILREQSWSDKSI